MTTFGEMFNSNNEMALKWKNQLEKKINAEYITMKRKFEDDRVEYEVSTMSTVNETSRKPKVLNSEVGRKRTTASSTTRRPNVQSTSFYQNQVENNQGRINRNQLEINENSQNTDAKARMDATTRNHNAEQQFSTTTSKQNQQNEQSASCDNGKLLEELKELKDAVKEYERIFHEHRRAELNRRKECEIVDDNTEINLKEIAIRKLKLENQQLKDEIQTLKTIEQGEKLQNGKLLEELKELKDAVKVNQRISHENSRAEIDRQEQDERNIKEIEETRKENENSIKKLTQELDTFKRKTEDLTAEVRSKAWENADTLNKNRKLKTEVDDAEHELNTLKRKNEDLMAEVRTKAWEKADALDKNRKMAIKVADAEHRAESCQHLAIQHRQDDQKKYHDLSVKYNDLEGNYKTCRLQNARSELFQYTTGAPRTSKPFQRTQQLSTMRPFVEPETTQNTRAWQTAR